MDLSFIILEYDCPQEIARCLAGIREHAAETSCEIVVTSNSLYSEEVREKLVLEYPGVQWRFNERNGGYAYAMNRGIEAAKGAVIVLLNADARLKNDIGPALRYMNADPKVDLVGPKIVDGYGNLQDSARPFLTPGTAFRRVIKKVFSGKNVSLEKGFAYDKAQPVDWVIGAFMMVKRSAIEKVGLFDEGYFLYVEDMDWCRRFWDAGFEVHYFPELAVEYAGTRSSSGFLSSKGRPGRHALIHLKSYMRYLRKFGCQRRRPVGASPNS